MFLNQSLSKTKEKKGVSESSPIVLSEEGEGGKRDGIYLH